MTRPLEKLFPYLALISVSKLLIFPPKKTSTLISSRKTQRLAFNLFERLSYCGLRRNHQGLQKFQINFKGLLYALMKEINAGVNFNTAVPFPMIVYMCES